MSRYIDADKLKYSLELSVKSWGRDCNSKAPVIKTTYQDVLNRLEAMPAADVVEVVRCKDCKHLIQEIIGGDLELCCACFAGMIIPAPDRYCSYGERSEE